MILALDLSAALGLATLETDDGRLLSRFSTRPREHFAWLGPALGDLIRESGSDWDSLSQVAVGIGPGSFTGLRIALSAAKALAFGRDLPILPLPSLAIPARAATEFGGCIIARPARGNEFWAARFDGRKALAEGLYDPAALGDLVSVAAAEQPNLKLVGDLPQGDWPLPPQAEPDPTGQLLALASLSRSSEGLLRGPGQDRLLPRYILAPSVSRPRKKKQ